MYRKRYFEFINLYMGRTLLRALPEGTCCGRNKIVIATNVNKLTKTGLAFKNLIKFSG